MTKPNQPREMIRERELVTFTGLKPTAIEDQIRDGRFPAPCRIGKRAKAWFKDEILDWQRNLPRCGELRFAIELTNLPAPNKGAKKRPRKARGVL